ncbi:hypothetical protein Tco_0636817 [Tanacetum coccineum]
MDSEVMKGLSECKASKRNFRRIQVKDIIKEVEDYLKTYSSAAMDNSCSSDLKKAIENLEAEKKTMAKQIKAMQEQIIELSVNHQDEDDGKTHGSGVNYRGPRTWHSNDIKFEIPEYDGKIDPDEFVEWLRTVKCAFDYKATNEKNKVKIVAMKLQKYASTWWANTCTKRSEWRIGKNSKRLGLGGTNK